MEYNLFLQISALLAVTVGVAFIIRLLKQPLLVAYMLAGIICGPLFFNFLHGGENMYEAFANFGVVFLLFIVGLELNFSYLKKIGRTAVGAGIAQFILNFAVIFPLALVLGLSQSGAALLALVSCFSSTIVVLKILNDKQDEESVYGRYTIGLLLVQDIISITILIILSLTTGGGLVRGGLEEIVKVVLVILLVAISAKFILPRLLKVIATSGEFLFIFTVTWCFSVASLMMWSGFSLEIGAIIAGLSLGSSRYHLEIASRIKPLRDFFLVIFFIILGSQADFRDWREVVMPAIWLSIFILLVKPFVLYRIWRFFNFTRRNSFLSAISSAQLSEFGFIILFAAAGAGYLSGRELGIFTIAAILTIFVSSYAMVYGYKIYERLTPVFNFFGRDNNLQPEDVREKFDAMIFGYHRTGWKIGEALAKHKVKFAVVDFNAENISKLEKKGLRVFFGDASDIEFLHALPFDKVKIVVCTVPSPEDQSILFEYIRSKNKKAIIIACLYQKKYLKQLYAAGADYVLLPHLLGGSWLAGLITKHSLIRRDAWAKLRQQQAHDLE